MDAETQAEAIEKPEAPETEAPASDTAVAEAPAPVAEVEPVTPEAEAEETSEPVVEPTPQPRQSNGYGWV